MRHSQLRWITPPPKFGSRLNTLVKHSANLSKAVSDLRIEPNGSEVVPDQSTFSVPRVLPRHPVCTTLSRAHRTSGAASVSLFPTFRSRPATTRHNRTGSDDAN